MIRRILLSILLLTGGCAANGPAYSSVAQPKADTVKIVVYRPDAFLNFTARFWVEVNGVEICKLHNGSYLTYDAQPGKINIASSNFGSFGTSRLTVNAKAGQTIYVKMEMNGGRAFSGMAGGMLGQATDEVVSENAGPVYLGTSSKDKAEAEMQGLNQDCQ